MLCSAAAIFGANQVNGTLDCELQLGEETGYRLSRASASRCRRGFSMHTCATRCERSEPTKALPRKPSLVPDISQRMCER